MTASAPTTSRAVLRPIEAGSSVYCARCDVHLKFMSPLHAGKLSQVICNVYRPDGRWSHVEHYHPDCYREAGEPYGPVKEQR